MGIRPGERHTAREKQFCCNARDLLSVVCCVLSAVCCLLSVVCCLLSVEVEVAVGVEEASGRHLGGNLAKKMASWRQVGSKLEVRWPRNGYEDVLGPSWGHLGTVLEPTPLAEKP